MPQQLAVVHTAPSSGRCTTFRRATAPANASLEFGNGFFKDLGAAWRCSTPPGPQVIAVPVRTAPATSPASIQFGRQGHARHRSRRRAGSCGNDRCLLLAFHRARVGGRIERGRSRHEERAARDLDQLGMGRGRGHVDASRGGRGSSSRSRSPRHHGACCIRR